MAGGNLRDAAAEGVEWTMSEYSDLLKRTVVGGMLLVAASHTPRIEVLSFESPVLVSARIMDVDDHDHRERRGYVGLSQGRQLALATTSTGMVLSSGPIYVRGL